jgi:hypothetical protein
VVFLMRRPQIAVLPREVIVPLPFGSSRQARRARAGVRLARRLGGEGPAWPCPRAGKNMYNPSRHSEPREERPR